jgi:hypothetical protein
MVRVDESSKRALHAGALAFTAFWLIATTAEPEPPRPAEDCFTGIADKARLQVVLGTARPGSAAPPASDAGTRGADAGPDDARTSPPSCAGIDGLQAGAVLSLDLDHGARPEVQGRSCWGYEVTRFSGGTFLSNTESQPSSAGFAGVTGSFESGAPEASGCRGRWALELHPAEELPAGHLFSPFDAGGSEEWIVTRTTYLEQAQFCPGVAALGAAPCSDDFVVTRITELP